MKMVDNMSNTVRIKGIDFQKINERYLKKANLSNLLFVMVSQSGAIDRRGTVYFFTLTSAFILDKGDYGDYFIDDLFLYTKDWNLINVYFCDFIIINPDIYDSFVHELCARNQPYFWFQTAIDVYKNKYCD